MKYNKNTVQQIADLIAADSYTISEICKIVGIDEATYYRWQKDKSEFCEIIRTKKAEFENLLVVEAKRSLMRKIKGYAVTEVKTVTVPSKVDGEPVTIKEKTLTEKHIAPDTTALIFLLTNKAPDEYKHRQSVDAKLDVSTKISGLSESQLNQVIDQILNQKTDGK